MSFYKINRGILDSEVFGNAPYTEREAWIWLIGEAAWKDHHKPIAGKKVKIKRGQLSHSLRFMADRFQWSKNKVNNFLNKLELWGMIRTESGTGQNIITISNYSIYQDAGTGSGTALGTTEGQHRDKKEEIQERQEVKNKDIGGSIEPPQKPKKKVGNRLSEDWVLPPEWGEWAEGEGFSYDTIIKQEEIFKDYWLAKAGQAGVKLDWFATWRNWMRKQKEYQS